MACCCATDGPGCGAGGGGVHGLQLQARLERARPGYRQLLPVGGLLHRGERPDDPAPGPARIPGTLAFGPDGLLASGDDRAVRICEAASGRVRVTLAGAGLAVTGV